LGFEPKVDLADGLETLDGCGVEAGAAVTDADGLDTRRAGAAARRPGE